MISSSADFSYGLALNFKEEKKKISFIHMWLIYPFIDSNDRNWSIWFYF